MTPNLRHLRVFAAVVETGSVTRAADRVGITQPAVTQAIAKLERIFGHTLLIRTPQGVCASRAGAALAQRITRAFAMLDPCLADLSPRMIRTATASHLQALIATREAESFTLAARRLGIAQPSVHRAVAQLEAEAGRPLFERRAQGVLATKPAQNLALAARLAFAELDQAEAELGEIAGREVGRIVIGAMPLSRSFLLPRTIARFRKLRATLPINVLDGPYADMLAGLLRGDVDLLIGALRGDAQGIDIVQERLFDDGMVFVARPDHPVLGGPNCALADVLRYPIVVAMEGTPSRQSFDFMCKTVGSPPSLVETGSMILMRELLCQTDHLGCISQLQIAAEINLGAVVAVPATLPQMRRAIGLTFRRDWLATPAQADFIAQLRAVVADMHLGG